MNLNSHIANYLKSYHQSIERSSDSGLGFVSGSLGMSLCYYYYWLLTNDYTLLNAYTSSVLNALKNKKNSNSLGSGTASLYLLYLLCNESPFISPDIAMKLANSLNGISLEMLDYGNYSLFGGAAGLALGFAIHDDEFSYKAVKAFISKIESLIKGGWMFQEKRTENNNKGCITYIGTPHGITGLLLLVLIIKQKKGLVADNLIDYFVRTLMSTIVSVNGQDYFPHSLRSGVYDGDAKYLPWVCWSYGDLMSSYAILKAGVLINNDEYYQFGLNKLVSTVKRNMNSNSNDIGLCCGLSSIPIVYKAAYSLTGNDILSHASETWRKNASSLFEKLISETFDTNIVPPYARNPSLYYGVPGVFLSHLFFTSNISNWTSLLLI